MTLQEARNRMFSEMQFLGLDWDALREFLDESPGAFSYKTLIAYKVIREENPQ